MNKIFKIVFNCLLVLVIVLLVAYITLRFTNKIEIYNVETGSMEDKIHVGDYILLFKKSNYKVGDVVTYRVKDYFITHRIVKIENGKIITKGDANNTEDDGISPDRIVGKAVYWGGLLNIIINFKYVIIAILIGLYLISCYLGDDKEKDIDEDKNKEKTKNNDIYEFKEEDLIADEDIISIETKDEKVVVEEKITLNDDDLIDFETAKTIVKEENKPIVFDKNEIEIETKKKSTKTTRKPTNTKPKKTASAKKPSAKKTANTKKTTKKTSATKTKTKKTTKKTSATKTKTKKTPSTKTKSTSTKRKVSSKK